MTLAKGQINYMGLCFSQL